jgi:hypothetical protein
MAEAFIWLDSEAPGPPNTPVTIHFDSTYAHDAITGLSAPEHNVALINKAKELYQRVIAQRMITWNKVLAHSNNHGNEYADHLAGEGSRGKQTRQSPRWQVPVGSPAPSDPLLTDWCWRCGQLYSGPFYARQLAGHEAFCKVPGAPPPSIPCRRGCGITFPWQFPKGKRKQAHHTRREFRNKHEKICQGNPELTRTCPHCKVVLPPSTTDDMIISHLKSCSPDASHLDRMWTCPKCKSRIGFNHKETHIATCKGSAKDNCTCSKCKQLCQSLSACQKHTAVCRGSEEANLTCQTCNRKFKTFASRITHEKACT